MTSHEEDDMPKDSTNGNGELPSRPSQADIELRAAQWVLLVDGVEELNDHDAGEFHRWLRTDPRHAAEYKLQCAMVNWSRSLPSEVKERLRARIHAGIRRRTFLKRAFSRPTLLAGSAVALALAAAFFVVWIPTRPVALSPTTYATKTAETRTIQLPDASVIELNSRTRVQWSLNEQGRWLDLLDGEVYIDVAHDATRPFRVRVGRSEIRALGTRFDAYKKENTVVLTVAEGAVEVTGPEAGNSTARWLKRVSAPHTLEYQMSGAIQTDDNSTDALQWRAGTVHFREEPLSEAVEEP
jgi:transmembrane sensor